MIDLQYQVFLARLPGKVNEAVTRNEDDSYTIFIEDTLSPEYKKKAFEHALLHIKNGDFDNDTGNVQRIEAAAHSVQKVKNPSTVFRMSDKKKEKRIAALRRQRRKIQKELEAITEFMDFLNGVDPGNTYSRAERQWLHGSNL